jgi:hypothetical protein
VKVKRKENGKTEKAGIHEKKNVNGSTLGISALGHRLVLYVITSVSE